MTAADLDLEALREVVDAAIPKNGEDKESVGHTPSQAVTLWWHRCQIFGDTFDPPTVRSLLDALGEARGETINVAGGAIVEEAEQRTRRIHAEVERDVARQALVSADDMNRLWDELNAERDLLTAEVARLNQWKSEALEVLKGWDKVYDALGCPGQIGDHKFDAALREVSRLTAVVQGVKELADEWDALDMGTGLYPEDSAHRDAHESRSQQCAQALRDLIAGGTDTPKAADTEGDA